MLQVLGGILVAVIGNLPTESNFRDKIVFIEFIILLQSIMEGKSRKWSVLCEDLHDRNWRQKGYHIRLSHRRHGL